MSRPSLIRPVSQAKEQQTIKSVLDSCLQDPCNKICADCGTKQPRWAVSNIGCFICIRCSGIHRNLGVHISKVKSVSLDSWSLEQAQFMKGWGNAKVNALYEALLTDTSRKPSEADTAYAVESFIRDKYEKKIWYKQLRRKSTKVKKVIKEVVSESETESSSSEEEERKKSSKRHSNLKKKQLSSSESQSSEAESPSKPTRAKSKRKNGKEKKHSHDDKKEKKSENGLDFVATFDNLSTNNNVCKSNSTNTGFDADFTSFSDTSKTQQKKKSATSAAFDALFLGDSSNTQQSQNQFQSSQQNKSTKDIMSLFDSTPSQPLPNPLGMSAFGQTSMMGVGQMMMPPQSGMMPMMSVPSAQNMMSFGGFPPNTPMQQMPNLIAPMQMPQMGFFPQTQQASQQNAFFTPPQPQTNPQSMQFGMIPPFNQPMGLSQPMVNNSLLGSTPLMSTNLMVNPLPSSSSGLMDFTVSAAKPNQPIVQHTTKPDPFSSFAAFGPQSMLQNNQSQQQNTQSMQQSKAASGKSPLDVFF